MITRFAFSLAKGRWKRLLIIGILCIPILLLAGLFVSLSLKNIDFSSRELMGTTALRPVWRVQSALYGRETDTSSAYSPKEQAPYALPESLDPRLGLRQDYDELKRKLKAVDPGKSVLQGKDAGETVIGATHAFIRQIADSSNLTLDTNIDSYYLMVTAVNALPEIRNHSAMILIKLRAVSHGRRLDAYEQAEINTEITLLKVAIDEANASIASAIKGNNDSKLKAAIMPALDEFNRAEGRYLSQAMVLSDKIAEGLPLTTAELEALALLHQTQFRATDALWNAALNDLERLLNIKVNGNRLQLWLLIICAGVISAAAIGATIFLDLYVQREEILKLNLTLQQSNEELERFAFICSHDLQEPVRMMNVYAGLLQNTEGKNLNGEAQEYLQLIQSNAARMRDMIRDILDFSRIGREEIKTEPVNFNLVLNEVLAEFRQEIESSATVVKSANLPVLTTSPTMVRVLIQNLISNALKFQDGTRPPEIEINAERKGAGWRFSISDNGIGMDPAFHHKVFSLFGRLNPVHDYPGTGIGLSSCRKFIRICGGDMSFTSSPGQGSIFYFTLPVHQGGPHEHATEYSAG